MSERPFELPWLCVVGEAAGLGLTTAVFDPNRFFSSDVAAEEAVSLRLTSTAGAGLGEGLATITGAFATGAWLLAGFDGLDSTES